MPAARRPPAPGSAARRPAPRPHAVTAPRAVSGPPGEPARPRRWRFSGRAAVLLLVLLVLVISYASSLRAWLQQRGDLAAARADIAQTQAEVEALEQERLRWEDPAYVQQQARARFGWVLPGEVGYRVIDSDGTTLGAPAAPSAPTEAATEPAEWYASVWGSIEAAGEVQAPTAERTPARDGVITPHGRRGERHP